MKDLQYPEKVFSGYFYIIKDFLSKIIYINLEILYTINVINNTPHRRNSK